MAKQITIVSGKGGTGKTTFTAAVASLTKGKTVFADADVDAPDLHLILKPKIITEEELKISKKAFRNEDLCTRCNLCGEACRYDAIDAYNFHSYKCEGCGLCTRICPEGALTLKQVLSANLFVSDTRFGDLVHVEMVIGEGSSGRIVDAVRKRALKIAEEKELNYVIIDGPPGIGCPLISSITGTDLVIAIIEPTLSGIHDLERVLDLVNHFQIKMGVIINKFDINLDNTRQIEEYCKKRNIPLVGKISFNKIVPKSIIAQKTIFEMSDNPIKKEISETWENIETLITK